MCGRFTLYHSGRDVAARFLLANDLDWSPRYNLAPTQAILVIRDGLAGRAAGRLRWGLVPSWSKGPVGGPPLINARSETVETKPAFRTALAQRRCLVPADGFFEWLGDGRLKRPMYFTRTDGGLFAFAGLWERWEGPEGPLDSVAILTTEANDLVRDVHDRMPVILPALAEAAWLDSTSDPAALRDLLRPFPVDELTRRSVGPAVGSPRNDSPACIATTNSRPAADLIQRSLF